MDGKESVILASYCTFMVKEGICKCECVWEGFGMGSSGWTEHLWKAIKAEAIVKVTQFCLCVGKKYEEIVIVGYACYTVQLCTHTCSCLHVYMSIL